MLGTRSLYSRHRWDKHSYSKEGTSTCKQKCCSRNNKQKRAHKGRPGRHKDKHWMDNRACNGNTGPMTHVVDSRNMTHVVDSRNMTHVVDSRNMTHVVDSRNMTHVVDSRNMNHVVDSRNMNHVVDSTDNTWCLSVANRNFLVLKFSFFGISSLI